jgi:hypothetical protein
MDPVNDPDLFVKAVQSACQALISAEPEITKYDTIAGDGDCGLTLKAGAEGILDAISQKKITGHNLVSDLLQISEVVNRDMGGTSGGLYRYAFDVVHPLFLADLRSLISLYSTIAFTSTPWQSVCEVLQSSDYCLLFSKTDRIMHRRNGQNGKGFKDN